MNEHAREKLISDDLIRHMVNRFLMWRLPGTISPDGGISVDKSCRPVGTNLLSYTEAEAMVRNMLEGLPEEAVEISVTPAIYSDVRRALVERGRGGVILERPLPRRIEMTGVTLVERAEAKP